MPAAWMRAGWTASGRIMKSAKRSSGGCSLARMPDAAGAEIGERDLRQQPPRRFDERLQRLAVVLVIPFAFLVTDGGSQQDAAVGRPGQMNTEAVAGWMRHGIDE